MRNVYWRWKSDKLWQIGKIEMLGNGMVTHVARAPFQTICIYPLKTFTTLPLFHISFKFIPLQFFELLFPVTVTVTLSIKTTAQMDPSAHLDPIIFILNSLNIVLCLIQNLICLPSDVRIPPCSN